MAPVAAAVSITSPVTGPPFPVSRFLERLTGNGGPVTGLVMLTAAATGAMIGYLFVPYAYILIPGGAAGGAAYSKWHIMTLGTPAAIGIMLLAGVIHIGLMGRGMSDAHREWWGRLGGWLLLCALCWLFLFLVAIYFPAGLRRLFDWESHRTGHPITFTGVVVWILSTAYGVLFGKSENTSQWIPDAPRRKKFLALAAKLTPYVFIVGLLMALSVLASLVANWAMDLNWPTLALPSDLDFDVRVPLLCLLLFVGAVFLSWRVDINQFSIHYLYRNRLVRCYLGASVPGRNAQPFTGFSEADNVPLGSLKIPLESQDRKDGRPLPILNTSLNVGRGRELAMQTRKEVRLRLPRSMRVSQDKRKPRESASRFSAGQRNWPASYQGSKMESRWARRLPFLAQRRARTWVRTPSRR